MDIVHAATEDIPAIQKLLRVTWDDTYGNHLSQMTLDEVYRNWQTVPFLTDQIQNAEMYFPLVKESTELFGLATARIDGDVIVLFRLYVYPEHQRKGVGELLLNNIIEHFKRAKKIQLHAEEFNQKGIPFYKKHGFEEIKREVGTVGGQELNQILMEKIL